MEWQLQQADSAAKEIATAHYPEIRIFTVKNTTADSPNEDVVGEWKVCSPATIKDFSAVAYFFGRELHQQLHKPMGLINSSWGGTPIQAWTKQEALQENPAIQAALDFATTNEAHKQATLFNGMIAPLIPFGIKGVIWYQGESDTDTPIAYRDLFPNMITQWRKDWGTEFPFLLRTNSAL